MFSATVILTQIFSDQEFISTHFLLDPYTEPYENRGFQFNNALLPHSAPSWILSYAENLARWSHEVAIIMLVPPTHQPPPTRLNAHIFMCGVPTLVWTSDQIASIGIYSGFHLLLLKHLFNSVINLASSTCIFECGTPSWACFIMCGVHTCSYVWHPRPNIIPRIMSCVPTQL